MTRRPSETVASCKEPEPMDKRRGAGLGRAGKRRKNARNPRIGIGSRRDVGNGVDLVGGRRKKRRQESFGSVDVDPEDRENTK